MLGHGVTNYMKDQNMVTFLFLGSIPCEGSLTDKAHFAGKICLRYNL